MVYCVFKNIQTKRKFLGLLCGVEIFSAEVISFPKRHSHQSHAKFLLLMFWRENKSFGGQYLFSNKFIGAVVSSVILFGYWTGIF